MKLPEYDVVINGAGPVGCSLALLLARKASHPKRIALVGKPFNGPNGATPARADPRTLALNHGSRVLLEQLDAWPDNSTDILSVHVSQHGRLGRTLIDHRELAVSRLGSVVPYSGLLTALQSAVGQSGIDVIHAPNAHATLAGHVQVDLGDRVLTSALVIQSDGARPAGIHRDYHQHAVLTLAQADRPMAHRAYERFTSQGPLAVLPHPQGERLYGIVWCCHPDRASQLQALGDADFAQALQQVFGDRLGRLQCAGDRHIFPLALYAGPSLVNARTVAIGNAAQTLHPVAGQGLNLGLRDAVQLGHALNPWLQTPRIDPGSAIQAFARKRRPDRWLTTGLTDFLPRIFATQNPLVQHACGLVLLGLDLSSTIRTPLARHLLQGLRT